MSQDHNILWLQTTPSIAAIYYHTYLSKTHVLYCPDAIDDIDTLRVRELGHRIIKQMDADDKKLAVHFMQPCPVRKHQDLVRFIHSKRGSLNMKCLVLPTTPVQTKLLSGWAMALDPSYDERDMWLRRCLNHFHLDAFNNKLEENKGMMMKVDRVTEYMEPFCIADQTFEKRALIINVTRSLCVDKNAVGFVLNDAVEAAIHGWADVTEQLSLPGTVILIADENKLFKGIPSEQGEMQNKQLERHRDRTNRYLEQLGSECPIYLYTRDYTDIEPESIVDKIACIQHLHGLSITGSFMISWSRGDSGLERHGLPLKYVSRMRQFYLQEILVQKSRVIWKSDFLGILQRESEKSPPDTLRRIPPFMIDNKLSDKEKMLTPLLYTSINTKLTFQETFQRNIRHSVSASNTQVFQSWKNRMESIAEERTNKEKSLLKEQQSISFDNDNEGQDMASSSLQPEDPEVSNLRNGFADRIHHDIVSEYINNKGAFSRGEGILNTLDQMKMTRHNDSIDVWAKAHGSSKDAYDVVMTIVSKLEKEELEFKDGWCSCPVGKYGKCKHCTALLLRFMVNADEFEYVSSRSQRPSPPSTSINNKARDLSTAAKTTKSNNQDIIATVTKSQPLDDPISRHPKLKVESQAPVPNREKTVPNNISFDVVGSNRSFDDVTAESVQKKASLESTANATSKPLSGSRRLPWDKPASAQEGPKTTKRRGKKKETDTNTTDIATAPTISKKRKTRHSTTDDTSLDEERLFSETELSKNMSSKKPKTTTTGKRRKAKEKEVIEEKDDLVFVDHQKLTTRKRNPRRATKPKTYNESNNEDNLSDSSIPVSVTKSNKRGTAKSSKTEDFPFETFKDHGDSNGGDTDLMTIGSAEQRLNTRREPTHEHIKSESPMESVGDSYNDFGDYFMEKGLVHLALDNEKYKNGTLATRRTGQVSIRDSNSDDHPPLSNNYPVSNNQLFGDNDNNYGDDSDATDDGLGVIYRRGNEEGTDDKRKEDVKSMSPDYSLPMPDSMGHSVDDRMETTEDEEQKSHTISNTLAMTTDDLFDELGL